jgi:hypothetical protein
MRHAAKNQPLRPYPKHYYYPMVPMLLNRLHAVENTKNCRNILGEKMGEKIGGSCVRILLYQDVIIMNWRRGWDSNPRYGRTVHLISNQAHSTTLAPLHSVRGWKPLLRTISRLEAAPTNHIAAGSRSYEPQRGWKPLLRGQRIVRNRLRVGQTIPSICSEPSLKSPGI